MDKYQLQISFNQSLSSSRSLHRRGRGEVRVCDTKKTVEGWPLFNGEFAKVHGKGEEEIECKAQHNTMALTHCDHLHKEILEKEVVQEK